uniref:DUF3853 family protein n=1 Tax=Bacteroides finegoldii TaxID=338188 RepID=UPI00356A5E1F
MIGIERRFSDDTRLIDLTVGDLKELITSLIPKAKQVETKRYVYGYKGIAELFHCSLSKARSIKLSGKIDKAIIQEGRKIIVDAQLVFELLQKTNNNRRSR